jgi:hypothetical protein
MAHHRVCWQAAKPQINSRQSQFPAVKARIIALLSSSVPEHPGVLPRILFSELLRHPLGLPVNNPDKQFAEEPAGN